MDNLGRLLIIVGAAFIIAGVLIISGFKIPFLGNLPGDITIKRENFVFYFPLASSVIISIFITVFLWFIKK